MGCGRENKIFVNSVLVRRVFKLDTQDGPQFYKIRMERKNGRQLTKVRARSSQTDFVIAARTSRC